MTKNTIWVTGAEGRLGSALVQLLSQDIDNKVIGTDKAEVDITDMAAVRGDGRLPPDGRHQLRKHV